MPQFLYLSNRVNDTNFTGSLRGWNEGPWVNGRAQNLISSRPSMLAVPALHDRIPCEPPAAPEQRTQLAKRHLEESLCN